MNNSTTIEEAMDLYAAYHDCDTWLGPFPFYSGNPHYDAQRIQDGIMKIVREAVRVHDRCLRVPSPWHAALLLIYLQHHLLGKNTHLLFRGQALPTWTLVPSLERAQDKPAAGRSTEAFLAILNSVWPAGMGADMPPSGHIAAAQHYGIPTNLLDFTPHGAVAVYFADDRRFSGEIARVFVVPFAAAKKLNARVILPPPLIKRLYAQLGIFLEFPEQAALGAILVEVEFLIDASAPPFDVMRHQRVVDLKPRDKWLEDAAAWAMQWGASGQDFPVDAADVNRLLLDAFAKIGFPHFPPGGQDMLLAQWVDFFGEMLYWLVIIIDKHGEAYDVDTLKMIVQSNPSLVGLVIPIFVATAVRERPHNPQLARNRVRVAKTMREMLRNIPTN